MDALTDTFDEITQDIYQPGFIDQIFGATPFWSEFAGSMKTESGKKIIQTVQTAKLGGGRYGPNGQLTLTTPEIADHCEYDWSYYYVPIKLSAQDVDLNGSAGREKIVDMLDSYTKNAGETLRDEHLGTDIFRFHINEDTGTNTPASLEGLLDLCQEVDYTGTSQGEYSTGYGGILVSDVSTWKAHVLRATGSTGAYTGQDCTIQNVADLIQEIVEGSDSAPSLACGEKPDILVTTGTVWSLLKKEIRERGYASGITMSRTQDIIDMGFQAFEIEGVPCVMDTHISSSSFDGTEAANTLGSVDVCPHDNGHSLFAVNFDYFYPVAHPKWNGIFGEWESPHDYHQYINKLFWWGNMVCTQRRAHGAIYNIDETSTYDA